MLYSLSCESVKCPLQPSFSPSSAAPPYFFLPSSSRLPYYHTLVGHCHMYTPSASHKVGFDRLSLSTRAGNNPDLQHFPFPHPSCFALLIEHPSPPARHRARHSEFNNRIRIRTGEAKTREGTHTSAHHRKPPTSFLTSSHLPACTSLPSQPSTSDPR